jgi:hypothetical protein
MNISTSAGNREAWMWNCMGVHQQNHNISELYRTLGNFKCDDCLKDEQKNCKEVNLHWKLVAM